MSWTSKLLQTYDLCTSYIDVEKPKKTLLPIGHLIQRAQIEVMLDEDGNIIGASTLDIEGADTLIPVTEDSGSRSSGISPHPLHDKLIYVAGDYGTYVDEKKTKYHEKYMEFLYQWSQSSFSYKTIQIIYEYLKKGSLIHDLIEYGILFIEDGKLDKKKKMQKVVSQSDCLVRFYVNEAGLKKPWMDMDLFQSFIDYYSSLHRDDTSLCYITGNKVYCTDKHPSKIRFNSDNAKLISSNDASGFTYRGRIATREDALSIGYETSQKIHNALRWLIHKQGYQKDGLTVLIWNIESKPIVSSQIFDNSSNKFVADTLEAYAKKVNCMIDGMKEELDPRDGVVIMMLESATKGRLSITCYQELQASQYYENLKTWYTECEWRQYDVKNKVTTPHINTIISTIYDVETNKGKTVETKKSVDKMKLILPCILFGKKIPKSILQDAYHRVLQSTKVNKQEFKKCVGVLCALMRRQSADQVRDNQKGAIWSMDVKENKENGLESTAYLYGRLLAVYYEIEWKALRALKQDREPNAIKYMVQAKKFPWRTVNTLDSLSVPYLTKIGGRKTNLSKLKAELMDELAKRPDVKSIRNLDYDFVMGFECQMQEYETKQEIKENNESSKAEMEEK